MDSLFLSKRVLNVIDKLVPSGTLEDKLTRLAESELRRRLARYQLTDYQFQTKYGMMLKEFEGQEIVSHEGYGFDVESDYQDWNLAVDGIRSTERRLVALGPQS